MFRDSKNVVRFSVCKRKADEIDVKPHLAYTVSEAHNLIKEGRAISTQEVASSYYDGEPISDDAQLDFLARRGVDINDAWNDAMTKNRTMRRYGLQNVTNGVGSASARKGGQ